MEQFVSGIQVALAHAKIKHVSMLHHPILTMPLVHHSSKPAQLLQVDQDVSIELVKIS
jgi:hypothetical protein